MLICCCWMLTNVARQERSRCFRREVKASLKTPPPQVYWCWLFKALTPPPHTLSPTHSVTHAELCTLSDSTPTEPRPL